MNPEAYGVNWREAFRAAWTAGVTTPEDTWTWTSLPRLSGDCCHGFDRGKFYFCSDDKEIKSVGESGIITDVPTPGGRIIRGDDGFLYIVHENCSRDVLTGKEEREMIHWNHSDIDCIPPGWKVVTKEGIKTWIHSSGKTWQGDEIFAIFRNQPVCFVSYNGFEICIGASHFWQDGRGVLWCRPMNKLGPYIQDPVNDFDPVANGFFKVKLSTEFRFGCGGLISGKVAFVMRERGMWWLVKQD